MKTTIKINGIPKPKTENESITFKVVENLVNRKLKNWNAVSDKINAEHSKTTKTKVFIDYNNYGKRVRKPYSIAKNSDNEYYLKKCKGKVIGQAVYKE
jgi:hypothetical protein